MRKLRLVAMTIISFVLGNFIHTEKYLQNNTYSNFYQDRNTFIFIDNFVLVQYDDIILFVTKPVLFSFRMLDSLVTIGRNVSPSKRI